MLYEACLNVLCMSWIMIQVYVFFFFQAEDGIRGVAVTGVQTCALPILSASIVTTLLVESNIVLIVSISGIPIDVCWYIRLDRKSVV